jgi:hypothetical protein
MNRVKITLVVAISIALAFTFSSCGGSKPAQVAEVTKTGRQTVETGRDKLIKICDEKYYDNNYCGVGIGTNNNERIAANMSSLDARNNLASQVGTRITSTADLGAVGLNKQGAEALFDKIRQNINEALTDVRIRETITEYEEKTDTFIIYTLISCPLDAGLRAAKKAVSNEETLTDALTAKALMDIIDAQLNK